MYVIYSFIIKVQLDHNDRDNYYIRNQMESFIHKYIERIDMMI